MMIGIRDSSSLHRCVETALADDAPGDLIECGGRRGWTLHRIAVNETYQRQQAPGWGAPNADHWKCHAYDQVCLPTADGRRPNGRNGVGRK